MRAREVISGALYGLSWMKDRTLFTPSTEAALAMIRSAFA